MLEISNNNCWHLWNLIELVLNFSIFLNDFKPSFRVLFRQHQNKLSYTPPFQPWVFESPFETLIWIVLTFKIAFINNLLLFNPFQLSVVLHIEKVKLQMKPDFCMECCTGLKCVKRECSLPQILNLTLPKCF